MLDYTSLYQQMQGTPLEMWSQLLPQQLDDLLANRHGMYDHWQKIVSNLPPVKHTEVDFNADDLNITLHDYIDHQQLQDALLKLSPWRKGPYRIQEIFIDTEWHSDWKWNRISKHITDLTNRVVLDVGCGNGYHCWRMYGAGAKLIIGIDPSWLFLVQFEAIRHFTGERPVYLLPMGFEMMPAELNAFDTVFSMGVFYHRRSPIDHLLKLKDALRKGGELVLETLIIEAANSDKVGEVLVPENRYAQMRNVWFIPSVNTLTHWLRRCGFEHIRVIDITQTNTTEQRSTAWMKYDSLDDFLDPDDPDKTIEGYPAPRRATFIAVKN